MRSKTWVNIDVNALKQNFINLSKIVGDDVKKMAVVKSNAYGHGMHECAKIFTDAGADFLGVDSIEEAVELRQAGSETPILVLGWTPEEYYQSASEENISITISSMDSLKKAIDVADELKTPLKVHIKADTGLHRQGFLENEMNEVVELLKDSKIVVEGLYTHLAAAETPKLEEYTKKQITEFKKWIDAFKNMDPITHSGASAAATIYADTHFDMVRLGISMYGLWPSEEVRERSKGKLEISPALSWEAKVSEVKEIKEGEPVGYDCTEKVDRDSKIAVIPIGYWHGVPRASSRKGVVMINDKEAKILGNVSMDMIIVDVTDIKDVFPGSTATIIGKGISAEDFAKTSDSINYEVVTRINQNIPRIYS